MHSNVAENYLQNWEATVFHYRCVDQVLQPNLGPVTEKDTCIYGPHREKTCLRGFVNNTGTDQPAHPRSLISAFFIHFLESIICKLAAGEISTF